MLAGAFGCPEILCGLGTCISFMCSRQRRLQLEKPLAESGKKCYDFSRRNKNMNMKKNKKGFTLMEMLIVVAIIAVLVAIAIPVLSNNLHKAKVAADWANLRSYYAVLQADYIQTGEYQDEIGGWKYPQYLDAYYDTIYYPDGKTIKLQAGIYMIRRDGGYVIVYQCNSAHDDCFKKIG
jgi:prepilin-type N-terminal cleavage/methylation domain-containing protein